MIEILSWLIFGLIAGVTAKWLLPAKHEPQGCLITSLVGILGAVIGGIIGKQLGLGTVEKWDFRGLALAVMGSVILLFLFNLIKRK